jgi:hypothetical protein
MTKMITIQTVFILGMVLTIFLSNSNINQETYGHNFTTDESASFLAFTYQLQVESDLVKANLLTDKVLFLHCLLRISWTD